MPLAEEAESFECYVIFMRRNKIASSDNEQASPFAK